MASLVVLALAYTVSYYAAAAPEPPPPPTPTPAVIVVQGTPVLVVVTATPLPPLPSLPPGESPTAPPAPTRVLRTPTATQTPTETAIPSPTAPAPRQSPTAIASPTFVPVRQPLPTDVQMEVRTRVPLSGTLPGPRLAWTGPSTLWLADATGTRALNGPAFTDEGAPAPYGVWGTLAAAPATGRLAGAAPSGAVIAEPGTGIVISSTLDGEVVGWLDSKTVLLHSPCAPDCTTLQLMAADTGAPAGALTVPVARTEGSQPLLAPGSGLVAMDVLSHTATLIADVRSGRWWYLGGWQNSGELKSFETAAGWLDGNTLLTYHRSPSGETVNGHGRDLWQWDVRANSGRFLAADVATAVPSPDGQAIALVLLGDPVVENGILVGGYWRAGLPTTATVAIADLPAHRLRWWVRLADYPAVERVATLDGWSALRAPVWAPDGSALVAFDGEGFPVLLPGGGTLTFTRLLDSNLIEALAWAPDSQAVALLAAGEVWVFGRLVP